MLGYVEMLESFGSMSLYDHSLNYLLDNSEINYDAMSLNSIQNCIAKAIGANFLFLPINSIEEKNLLGL